MLAADVESGTSAFVRVVLADKHFKEPENFKRIFKKEAEIIKPILAKAGITLDPALDEQEQLEAHAAHYRSPTSRSRPVSRYSGSTPAGS